MGEFPYLVEWLKPDGSTASLSFGDKLAALAKFDRAVSAGATWARFTHAATGHVYFEHGVCVLSTAL